MPPPDSDKGRGPLELPGRLPDQERFLGRRNKIEGRLQPGAQPRKGIGLRPIGRRCEFLQPGTGRREDKLTARSHQGRETIQQEHGFRQTAEKVGSMNPVKGSQIGGKVHRIPLLETHTARIKVGRKERGQRSRDRRLLTPDIRNRGSGSQRIRRRNECMGKIDSRDLVAMPGHLERGPADRTTQIEAAGNMTRRETGRGAHGKVDGLSHPSRPGTAGRKDFIRGAEVKQEVFREDLVGFVNGAHFAGISGHRPGNGVQDDLTLARGPRTGKL